MSGANAPLISNGGGQDLDDDARDDGHFGESAQDDAYRPRQPDAPPTLFVWLLVLSAGISGLLFGYDTGVISSTLVSIGTSLSGRRLTSLDKSVITSSTSFFALLVSPFSALVSDSLGRKRVILLADLLFAAGALLQAASGTVASMVLGRSVVGAAVGAASFAVPLYIAETAPASHRGRLVTLNVLCITLGQVVAYVVGWTFTEYGPEVTGWRWVVGLGAVPALLQLVLLLRMPETPRWYVQAGRSAEALAVIRKVAGDTHSGSAAAAAARLAADRVLKDIEIEVHDEAASRRRLRSRRARTRFAWLEAWGELLSVRRNRRALTIACLLQGLQQLCGFNSLMYFSASIFELLLFRAPTLVALTVAVNNFLFSIAALVMIDRVGRRRMLLLSLPFMIGGLLLAAYGFSRISISPQPLAASSAAAGVLENRDGPRVSERGAAVVVLLSLMVYVASYATGLGIVPWMQSELFALSVRSVGSGVATGTNWLANTVIGLTFLPLMDVFGPSWTFILYAAICAVGYVLVWSIYPEMSGLTLEEAAGLLDGEGWGVW